MLFKIIPTNVWNQTELKQIKKLNCFAKRLDNNITSIVLYFVRYCRKKNITRYGSYVAFFIKKMW